MLVAKHMQTRKETRRLGKQILERPGSGSSHRGPGCCFRGDELLLAAYSLEVDSFLFFLLLLRRKDLKQLHTDHHPLIRGVYRTPPWDSCRGTQNGAAVFLLVFSQCTLYRIIRFTSYPWT